MLVGVSRVPYLVLVPTLLQIGFSKILERNGTILNPASLLVSSHATSRRSRYSYHSRGDSEVDDSMFGGWNNEWHHGRWLVVLGGFVMAGRLGGFGYQR
jgi:hypothetical protein